MESENQTPRLLSKLKDMFPFDWGLLRYAGAEPVPHHLKKWWWCLGGTVFYLFAIQLITGLALTFYYIPAPAEAYESVSMITHEIRFGWFIRSLHKWSSHFMIVALFLHMLRVFITGAYRHPRQLNWMAGCMLLGLGLTFGFTGYSLVYEQLSFWGATVACNLAEAIPLIGSHASYFLRGGAEIGPNTLTRFYILHVGVLPVLSILLLSVHILMIRLHGVTELHFEGEVLPKEKRFFRFWPEHVATELMVGVIIMYILVLVALIFPAELGEPANPNVTPEHIKPEWYFYFNFRLLKLTSLKVSVLMTMAVGAIFFFWPFLEEQLSRRFRLPDWVSVMIGVLGFMSFLILTVWEAFSP